MKLRSFTLIAVLFAALIAVCYTANASPPTHNETITAAMQVDAGPVNIETKVLMNAVLSEQVSAGLVIEDPKNTYQKISILDERGPTTRPTKPAVFRVSILNDNRYTERASRGVDIRHSLRC